MKRPVQFAGHPVGCQWQTFTFTSRNTWNVQYIAWSNLWDANHNGTRTFTVLVATHEMSSEPPGGTYGLQNAMALQHSPLLVVAHETPSRVRGATDGMRNTMELRHSILLVVTHEMASSLPGAICGMQNKVALLRHSPLLVVTHETSSLVGGATCGMQNAMYITSTTSFNQVTHSNPTKYCPCHEKWDCNFTKYCPPVRWVYISRFGDAFRIEKCNIWRSGYHSKFHEIWPLPRERRSKYCPCHKRDTATSPNTAPSPN